MASAPTPMSRYSPTRDALGERLEGEPRYRIDQLWQGLYEQCRPLDALTNLPAKLRDRPDRDLPTALTQVTESVSDDGMTIKWLWQLADGAQVETVLMHYDDRSTVCVSSQAGCAMGCTFCATGQGGFERHLDVGEIVEQVVRARWRSAPRRLSNVVFMGMGEPLANFDATWGAVERIQGDLGLSARHLTISTVGVLPGIRRLAAEDLPVTLAVSLHAANDELRNELVPLNRRYPIADLLDTLDEYRSSKSRRISFEWALIDGVNDRDSDARELAGVARRARAHINLIPLNPTPGYPVRGTPAARVRAFAKLLDGLGANATVRRNRGTEIDAACGQLRASQGTGTAVASPVRR